MKERISQKKGRIVAPKVINKVETVDKIATAQQVEEILKPVQVYPQIVKTMQIKEGNNIFEVALTKMANRSYQIKILFNGNEIRPATYTGMSPAMNYWNLLNGSKK
jgi:hypothetical protein